MITGSDVLMLPYERRAMARGHEEGRVEGLREGQQQAILAVLETRFGKVPAKARKRVQSLTADALLQQALRLAATAPTLHEFLQQL